MTVRIEKPAINVREELADLRKPTGIAGEAMLRAETPQEQFNLIGAGRRNFIINGGSKAGIISQRGSYQNYGPVTHAKYYYDRWQMFVTSMTTNISTTDGWFKAVATSTDGRFGFQQRIEDYNVFADQEFTVSARVKSNNPKARIYVSDGSGVWTTAHSGSGSEELLVVHGKAKPSPSYLYVYMMVSEAGGGETSVSIDDYIEFTNVQLELGKVATPFEHRSYGEELALCQRYFETIKDNKDMICVATSFSDQAAYGSIDYKVEKRATPTITFTGGASNYRYRTNGNNLTLASIGVSSVNDQNFRIDIGVGAGNTVASHSGWLSENTGATGIQIDAEL